MTLAFGYNFLKQIGNVAYNCPLDGQIIKQLDSFDNSFIHVVTTFDTVVSETWNLHANSSAVNRDVVSRNSCSNDSFFFGPFLLIGGRSFGHTVVMII